jgi:hypothetical protein
VRLGQPAALGDQQIAGLLTHDGSSIASRPGGRRSFANGAMARSKPPPRKSS